jgi:diguanylate cyclase (GGDEF)-like protein/PAS domain S-box-containing protein
VDKVSVLIVEDDNIIAEDLGSTLERLGYEVLSTASSGEDAVRKARAAKPDLVLMDIVLKGRMDGIKAADRIMKELDIPVVYLTSHSDPDTIRRAKETGPFGYLLKPYEQRDIQVALETAVSKHGFEMAIKEREHWLSGVLKGIGEPVIVADDGGSIKFMNPAAEALTGWLEDKAMGMPLEEVFRLVEEGSDRPVRLSIKRVMERGRAERITGQTALVARGGTQIPVDYSVSPLSGKGGGATGVVLVFHDVTARREHIKVLESSEQFLNTIFDSIYDPFCIFNREMRIVRANEAYAALKGKALEKLIGGRCYEEPGVNPDACKVCVVKSTFLSAEPNSHEKHLRGPDGSREWFDIFTHPIKDEEGTVTHVLEYSRGITERKRAEEERKELIKELQHLSRIDVLTGLKNRRALMDALEHEVERCRRYGADLSLILCDIDNFKEINDTYGHAAGDSALALVSNVFREVVRKTDVAGRYGGDEFMLVMPETGLEGAKEFAERILVAVGRLKFRPVKGKTLRMSMSLGLSVFDSDSDNVDTLISRADDAMYTSKRKGRNRVTVMLS